MNKLVMILMAMLALFVVGCASNGDSMSGAMGDGGLPAIAPYDAEPIEPLPGYGAGFLPEIAPYDEVAVEPMPAFVPAQ